MRKLISLVSASALVALLILASVPAMAAAAGPCLLTGFRGLTAAQIGGSVSGPLDASGCDIGAYFDAANPGSVSGATISGANWYGVLVNGDNGPVSVNVTNSSIHGVGVLGIYYRAYLGGAASGQISGNQIWNYGLEGIVTNGPGTRVQIQGNSVTGSSGASWNVGIQDGFGASASVTGNTVSDNLSYVSGGITVVGGPGYGTCTGGIPCPYTLGTQIVGNTLTDNDIGVWLSNCADSLCGTTSQTATNIKVGNNVITDSAALNNYYQAGVSDVGNNDKIIADTITGAGYDSTTCSYCYSIDAALPYSVAPKVHANTTE